MGVGALGSLTPNAVITHCFNTLASPFTACLIISSWSTDNLLFRFSIENKKSEKVPFPMTTVSLDTLEIGRAMRNTHWARQSRRFLQIWDFVVTNAEPIDDLDLLQRSIASELADLGKGTPYAADANEPDPRYLGYGVRSPEMKRFLSKINSNLSALSEKQKVELAARLIGSGYGEQKSVALALLERVSDYFNPTRFDQLEALVSGLHGWSKIDGVTKVFLPKILEAHVKELMELLSRWNADDDYWLRRASVVIFTRKVAKSGLFKDVAVRHCNALLHDDEHLVQTGVGWCLRDLMRWHKEEILEYVIGLRKRGVSSKITLYALRDIKGEERQAVFDKSR